MPNGQKSAAVADGEYLVGALITDLYDLDMSDGTFKADLWLWSIHRRQDDNGLDGLRFVNAAAVEQTTNTVPCENTYWTLNKVRGTFRHDWNTRNIPFDRHNVSISLEVIRRGGHKYRIDTQDSTFDKSISSRLSGWTVSRFSLNRDDVLYPSPLGDPSGEHGCSFQQIRIGLSVERDEVTTFLKFVSPAYIAFMVAVLSFFVIGHREGLGIQLCVGALFAATINLIAISTSLGQTPSMTFLDKIQIIILLYILVACAIGVIGELRRKADKAPVSLRASMVLFFVTVLSFLAVNLVLLRQASTRFRSVEDLAHAIRYEDEVLTQSIRNYVFTGNREWLDRHKGHVNILGDAISEAVQRGDGHAKDLFGKTLDKANDALLALEAEAIRLMENADAKRAVALLDGDEYARQKWIFSNGIDEYFRRISPNYLNHLAYIIRYEDEVLTQSARNYAFTGDDKWRQRYATHADILTKAIQDAVRNGDDVDRKIFRDINESHTALTGMEDDAQDLVQHDRKNEAVSLLDSKEYRDFKLICRQGLEAYFRRHVD